MRINYLIPILLLAAVFTGCSSHSSDRGRMDGHPPQQKTERPNAIQKLSELRLLLDLSAEQVSRIKPVLAEEYRQFKQLEEDDPDHEEFEKRKSDIDWEVYKQLNKILTEKQMYDYLKYMEKYNQEERPSSDSGQGGMGGRGGPGGPPGGGRGRF